MIPHPVGRLDLSTSGVLVFAKNRTALARLNRQRERKLLYKEYTALVEPDRLWVRVLPTHEALSLCREAGVESAHVIAMQGPFTRDLNAAMYDMLDIRVMVTKDSGKQGGVEEKVIPALERDIHVILIDRPGEVSYAG